jgi:LysM repeat protein/cell division protein FtsB
MRRYGIYFCLCALLLCFSELAAALKKTSSWEDQRSLRDLLEILRHEIASHDNEIETLRARIRSQEDAIESLKQDQEAISKASRNDLRGTAQNLEERFSIQEKTLNVLIGDLKQFKSHYNESATVTKNQQERMAELEKALGLQEKNIDHLKKALKILMDAIGSTETEQGGGSSSQVHQVKVGDSLGLIAQKYRVSVREIKDLNQLKNDMIYTGQKLQIPVKG